MSTDSLKVICLCILISGYFKESACNAGDPGSIPGLERSPGEGKGLENSMDYSPWGRKKSEMTERLSLSNILYCGLESPGY